MEAKNTVLPYLKVSNQIPMTLLEFIAKLEEQAEISFKAGADEEAKKGIARCAMTYDDGKRAGIKEVVEFVLAHKETGLFFKHGNVYIKPSELQAKLEEWGIKPVAEE